MSLVVALAFLFRLQCASLEDGLERPLDTVLWEIVSSLLPERLQSSMGHLENRTRGECKRPREKRETLFNA